MLDIKAVETSASELALLYQQMEDDLLKNIARRLKYDDAAGGTLKWQLKKLQEIGALNKANVKILAKYSGKAEKLIKKTIVDAGLGAIKQDETVYQIAFGEGKLKTMALPAEQSPYINALLRLATAHAVNEMNLVNTAALESAKKIFTDAVNQAYLETLQGVYSYQEAIRKAVRKAADGGIKGAHYISAAGREMFNHLDVAIRRAVLTTTKQVAHEMQLQRAKEWGSDLVEVSSHVGARPSHAVWQGQIYSISGKSTKYKSFVAETGYGDMLGLGGINCHHSFYPFFEGLSTREFYPVDEEENKKQYESMQQQRKIEREIRKVKRRIIAAEAQGDHAAVLKYNKQLKVKQMKMRAHIKQSGLTRRRDREQVLGYSQMYQRTAKQKTLDNNYPVIHFKKSKTINFEPMNEERYKTMKKALKRQDVSVISAKGDDLKFLDIMGAEAMIVGNDTILHRGKIPSASAFFEEIIHLTQIKKYGILKSSDVVELAYREAEAQRKLLKNAKAYGFKESDVVSVKRNKKYWDKILKERTGMSYERNKELRNNR